ncbi:anthranilate synthase [Chamaesiphon sp. OTE_75_metabat_556]|uniref:anthranilate synthase n=1 Tax=Chamaesiphon sp. OTE_75_metabat_556 TaxID=2964692 RepID=UPI00286ACFB0|nr:anthranilate synthase [Chamaesiphon sp. OTE_75_metabat_556]
MFNPSCYITQGKIHVSRSSKEISIDLATKEVLSQIDSQRGGLLTSNYEYPGRYKKWAIGFVNPPLEISTREDTFSIKALNQRGLILIAYLSDRLAKCSALEIKDRDSELITGFVRPTTQVFTEEERSQQPSVFSLIREVIFAFHSNEDAYLGLYGAFGYDLVFQFEKMTKNLPRSTDARDLVLYLPDELTIVDYQRQQAFQLRYDFEIDGQTNRNLPRTGEFIDYRGQQLALTKTADHAPGEYAAKVETALDYFRRGDLFEVVTSQSFFESYDLPPTALFETLQQINPSPFSFVLNLGGEYIVGASPEMFVRVEDRRVETCPISGTIRRGSNSIEDAANILELLNSRKDESELTMCTDVDRNDKSRICQPGSVKVLSRRQIELYSHLIHTVDHVEGLLRPEFDAIDAFLSHLWAVTVTGAPKKAAMEFLEQHERSARQWYGGAVGYLTFKGDLNTGLILRTVELKDSIAQVRVGATLLYDSIPAAEEAETLLKGAAAFQTLKSARISSANKNRHAVVEHHPALKNRHAVVEHHPAISRAHRRVLLIDYEDSFVHTLANYLRQCGVTVTTLRHGFSEQVFDQIQPDLVVLSPGPGKPSNFGITATIQACVKRQIPIFGVCLGLQSIVEAYGGELGVLDYPQHGKAARIRITAPESILFKGLPAAFDVGRYHSLYAIPHCLPSQLQVTAVTEDGTIMAIEHRNLPIVAVQFHPESIMTLMGDVGLGIIKNVVNAYTNPVGFKQVKTLTSSKYLQELSRS